VRDPSCSHDEEARPCQFRTPIPVNLEAGHLLYLPAGEPHALHGIKAGSLLLTVLAPRP
jgi:hypothetical protein